MARTTEIPRRPTTHRLIAGVVVLVVTQLFILLVPWVQSTDWSAGWKTLISGLLVFGIPDVGILAAIAIMGKEGFRFVKGRVMTALGRALPPDEVSPVRYRVGLVLFITPLLLGLLTPYLSDAIPGYAGRERLVAMGGDAMLIVSFFVLGGDFWDKLRALFVRSAKVTFG